MTKTRLSGVLLLTAVLTMALVVSSSACAGPRSSQPVMDYSTFIADLRDSGITVEEAGEISQPFFSVKGKIVHADGADIQVFEYLSPQAMDTESKRVSPDGYTFTLPDMVTSVDWIAPPHLYKAGRIIVIYVGNDGAITGALEKILTMQFAGARSP